MSAALNFTTDTNASMQQVKRWPKWFRSTAVWLGLYPPLRKAQAHCQRLCDFFEPIVEERRALVEEGRPVPDDMFQWMLEKTTSHGIINVDHLVDMQLMIFSAAIHTASSATAMMYDIAMRPEVIQDIRKEIVTALKETDGVMTSAVLFNMELLDSCMRESQRFTPPFTAGTFIDTPSSAVLQDPEHYTNPGRFDAYRFYNLRTNKDTTDPNDFPNREQYQFVSVTKENTCFGFG